MDWISALSAAGLATFLAWAGTGGVIKLLHQGSVLDHPNERSSHRQATPRGGGIAVIGAVLAVWVGASLLRIDATPGLWPIVTAVLALAGMSWLDDLRGLSAAWRLAGQALAVAVGLVVFVDRPPIFQGWLPPAIDLACAGLLWLWFVNLFNFMDGIDGISGTETASLGAGLALIAALFGFGDGLILHGVTLAAAALGFLWWNWQPARVFLGDVGSVPLGYLLGWLLLSLASEGAWAAALILPLYYLTDATLTLLRRLSRGEKIWQAHAQHFYQKAVRRGFTHAQTALAVLAANAILIVLAISAETGARWAALLAAGLTVAALLWHFAKGNPPPTQNSDPKP